MSLFYRAVAAPTRWAFRLGCSDVRVEGAHHVPETGPFLVLPNHESLLDPFFLLSFSPRPLNAMTKSTQFTHSGARWGLERLLAFPVRRYRTDAQAVRVALRILDEGKGVCIYPEGERSWDGALQPFRRGTLRLMLQAGVPVIPCGMEGLYDLWPRWARRPRRGVPIVLRFGKPLRFGPYADRAARDAALPEASQLLRDRLADLSGEERRAENWERERRILSELVDPELVDDKVHPDSEYGRRLGQPHCRSGPEFAPSVLGQSVSDAMPDEGGAPKTAADTGHR